MTHITTCTLCGSAYEESSEECANAPVRNCGKCFHDFRDRGDPMEKRYPASDWRSWEDSQQREHTPGLGRR